MQPEEKKRILELAGYRIDIAKEDLQVAAENMAAGHLRAAQNLAYYTIYHSLRAVLPLEGTPFKNN